MRTKNAAKICNSVPESANVEIAHHVQESGHGHETVVRRHSTLIEIGEALLLALVAISTAWSGYQSALWDAHSAKLYGTSSRMRITATQNTTRGGQQQVYDGTTFNFWLQAKLKGETRLVREYQKRFTPEYRLAFRAWLATEPFTNPKAPPGPIYVPQYHNALLATGAQQDKQASGAFTEAVDARETGDKYVRTTVLLATVLFLIALSQRFGVFKLRIALLVVAVVLLAVALGWIVTYPRL